ncbi:DUF6230 family protein [Streptomyces sp. DH12]|uniref:DUF6230 family protein n=1 Tax=Streptomyces sp. DH12 TaxID=2857010 RepID=UPI001E2D0F10|nr:DUF6230 family protein [Streptomyces sp. DH12]
MFAGALVSGLACAFGAAAAGTAAGVPVSFTVSGTAFKVSATRLEGEGFIQYASLREEREGTPRPVALTGIRSAELSDLCQSVVTPTPVGTITMRVTAGARQPVKAQDLVIDLQQMRGDVTFSQLELGRDASDSRVSRVAGTPGHYSQQASGVTIRNLRLHTSSMTAGTFQLTGMSVSMGTGRDECF